MAKVTGGTDGSISGAIGPVVFYKLRGKSYARRLQKERPKNSWKEKQRTHFQKFGKAAAFWRLSMPSPIKEIFNLAAENMTGYNLFMKTNLPAFNDDGLQLDLEWFHLSAGKLPLPHKLKAQRIPGDPNKIEVSWQNDSGSGPSRETDELTMVIAHDGKFTDPIPTGALRKEETAVIDLPSETENVQGVYFSFASVERKLYSEDKWFGM